MGHGTGPRSVAFPNTSMGGGGELCIYRICTRELLFVCFAKATLHISACVFLKLKKNYLYDKLNNFCKVCGIIIKTSTYRESQGIMVR